MFVYTQLKYLTTERRRRRSVADHFSFRERRTLHWNSYCVGMVLIAMALGGCAKLLPMDGLFAGFAMTLIMAISLLDETPEAHTPVWQGRSMLAATAIFYLGLGYCLGVLGLVSVPCLAALYRRFAG